MQSQTPRRKFQSQCEERLQSADVRRTLTSLCARGSNATSFIMFLWWVKLVTGSNNLNTDSAYTDPCSSPQWPQDGWRAKGAVQQILSYITRVIVATVAPSKSSSVDTQYRARLSLIGAMDPLPPTPEPCNHHLAPLPVQIASYKLFLVGRIGSRYRTQKHSGWKCYTWSTTFHRGPFDLVASTTWLMHYLSEFHLFPCNNVYKPVLHWVMLLLNITNCYHFHFAHLTINLDRIKASQFSWCGKFPHLVIYHISSLCNNMKFVGFIYSQAVDGQISYMYVS